MEVKIESTTENKLLDRKEIEAFVYFAGATPNRKEIKSTICGKIGADPDLVVLRIVKNEFGLRRAQITCHAYLSAEALRKNEPKFILKREGMITEEEAKKEAEKKVKAKAAKKTAVKKK
jgi:small subunit ribosomal protein S24e